MKKLIYIFLLSFILTSNIYAYTNMALQNDRAIDLNMRTQDYTLAMAFYNVPRKNNHLIKYFYSKRYNNKGIKRT